MIIVDFLREVKPFAVLREEDLEKLSSHIQEKSFAKGELIFHDGEESKFVWLVKSGWVHLVKTTDPEKPMILFTMNRREILCGVSAFDNQPYAADGVAATPCTLLKIPSEIFLSFLNTNPVFCREVLAICSARIRRMARKLGETMEPVSHRIAHILLDSIVDFGQKLPFTHREISQMIGARVETSIRTFKILREKGLLRIQRSCIQIDQPTALVRELNDWLETPHI
jgi:CRP/FNR family cyclic AMP-dependent transcriptional regulator